MAEILSFQDAQRRHARTVQRAAALDATAADRAEALSYIEGMTAFQAEMQRLTARFDILGDATIGDIGAGGRAEADIVWHPAMLRA
jgi:hypothetical protein